jgi:cysteinyl-tRNA synthetase
MMRIFNSLTRRLEAVEPLEGRLVRMYTCGPTVYNVAHLGNFRAYVFEDLLRRYLKWRGFNVVQAMNLTDVDDKTIRGAREKGVSLYSFTQPFKDAFFADLRTLNIEPAEHYPAATDHIPEMIALIGRLLEKGIAYRSDDGSIYFSIARFPEYGKLAHLDREGLRSGARVAQDEYEKENAADFALWKAWSSDDGDVAWDSPWGRGRPGWHIECSAMAMKYLGESFDLHTGGVDNMFPHHEDEIAQSEAATGKPFVKYWMHCAHLVVDGKKMSKSLGNFHSLRDVMARGYGGREIRYVLLGAQYRQSLNFTFAALDAARASLTRLDEFRVRLTESAAASGGGLAALPEWAERGRQRFTDALDDDLNMPEALAAIFDMAHDGNRAVDAGEPGAGAVLGLLADMDRVLGVLVAGTPGETVDQSVAALVAQRDEARKARQWAESDRLRKQLTDMGWDVKDTPTGTRITRRTP